MLALYGRIRLLKSFPYVGRPGSKAHTRELVLTRLPYIVVYRVTEEYVEVLSIRHAARRPEA
jgi:plasmid stabilization system protein ParE